MASGIAEQSASGSDFPVVAGSDDYFDRFYSPAAPLSWAPAALVFTEYDAGRSFTREVQRLHPASSAAYRRSGRTHQTLSLYQTV